MTATEIFLLLLGVMAVLAAIAHRLHVPSALALLLGGLSIALIPDMPAVALTPEMVFTLFLPPLLFEAAYFTSVRDFRANLRPILFLAIGLVVATSFAVGWVLQAILPGIPLALGVLLGAVVSPPDAAAAVSIARTFHLPRRISTILEGESLINDATGIVIYKFALAALATGGFSASAAAAEFIWLMAGGLAIGWALGLFFMKISPLIRDENISIVASFLVPYAAYVAAEEMHASGVLAVVAAGLVVGWMGPDVMSPRMRLRGVAVWQVVIFLINGFVFLLMGLQLRDILRGLESYSAQDLFLYGAAICWTVIVVRLVWIYVVAYGTRFLFPAIRRRDPYPAWQAVLILGWTGMRGVISLAMALSLPVTVPERDLLLFLTYGVICVTLLGQGLTLPVMLKGLRLQFDALTDHERWEAHKAAAEAALKCLDALAEQGRHSPATLDRLRAQFYDQLEELGDGPNTRLLVGRRGTVTEQERQHAQEKAVWNEILALQHDTVVGLRKAYHIGDEVLHEVLHELDLLRARYA